MCGRKAGSMLPTRSRPTHASERLVVKDPLPGAAVPVAAPRRTRPTWTSHGMQPRLTLVQCALLESLSVQELGATPTSGLFFPRLRRDSSRPGLCIRRVVHPMLGVVAKESREGSGLGGWVWRSGCGARREGSQGAKIGKGEGKKRRKERCNGKRREYCTESRIEEAVGCCPLSFLSRSPSPRLRMRIALLAAFGLLVPTLVAASLSPFSSGTTAMTFCKCLCFSNSTILPLCEHLPSSSTPAVQSLPRSSHADLPKDPLHPCLTCTRQFCLDQKLPACIGAKSGDEDLDTGTGQGGDVEARCFRTSFVHPSFHAPLLAQIVYPNSCRVDNQSATRQRPTLSLWRSSSSLRPCSLALD